MFAMVLSLLLGLLAFLVITRARFIKKRSTIPAPPANFFLGHILIFFELDPRPMFAFHQLKEKYGNLVSLNLVRIEMVIMSGYEDLKSFLNSQKSEIRLHSPIARILAYGTAKRNVGILFNGEPEFKELRRFTLKCFRDLGVGKNQSEAIVLEESRNLVEEIERLRSHGGGVISGARLDTVFKKTALNVVWHFCAGRRFDYEDKRMEKLLFFLDCFVILGNDILGKPLGSLPFLRHLPPYRSKYNAVKDGLDLLREFISESIEEHVDSLDVNNPRDLIDMYLIEAQSPGHSKTFTRENLLAICVDLFLAGTETTAKVSFFYVYVVYNIEIFFFA